MATKRATKSRRTTRKSPAAKKRSPSAAGRGSPAASPRAQQERGSNAKAPAKPAGKKHKKDKGDKVVRDTFSMPAAEYDAIGALKKRYVALGVAVKKSEILRAGIAMLQRLADEPLKAAASAVTRVRPDTGRRKKNAKRKQGGASA